MSEVLINIIRNVEERIMYYYIMQMLYNANEVNKMQIWIRNFIFKNYIILIIILYI